MTLRQQFFAQGRAADCPIFDLHGHMGPIFAGSFHNTDAASMTAVMERAGVKMLVFCHHAALLNPNIGNRSNIEAVRQFPKVLRAYCGLNPSYPDVIEQDVASYDSYADVYVGFKMLSDYHRIAVTDPRYEPAWRLADQRGLPVLLHTWGGSPYDGPEPARKAAEKYPRAQILLGHSCHGDWDKAIQLARDFPNICLDTCALLDERGIVERLVGELGADRIFFGTDFPWFSYHYYIGALLGCGLSDADCRKIFYLNARRILRMKTP